MSDFVTNRAARSTGAAETIQPGVPALFEPSGVLNHLPAAPEFTALEQERADEPDRRHEVMPLLTSQPLAAMPAARPEAAKHQSTPAGALNTATARQATHQNHSPPSLPTAPQTSSPSRSN